MIDNYDQLTIKQFLQCKMIADLEPDLVLRNMKLYSEISGTPLDEVEALPFNILFEKLKGLNEIEVIPQDGKVKMRFKLGGKKWAIKWRQQDLTGEQYIDATHFCKDQKNIVNNIHNILASITNERTWLKELPYDGNTHKERADLFFNEMKMKDAYPIMVFFCKYYQMLTDNMLTYLVEKSGQTLKEVEEHFTKNGVGLPQSTT